MHRLYEAVCKKQIKTHLLIVFQRLILFLLYFFIFKIHFSFEKDLEEAYFKRTTKTIETLLLCDRDISYEVISFC